MIFFFPSQWKGQSVFSVFSVWDSYRTVNVGGPVGFFSKVSESQTQHKSLPRFSLYCPVEISKSHNMSGSLQERIKPIFSNSLIQISWVSKSGFALALSWVEWDFLNTYFLPVSMKKKREKSIPKDLAFKPVKPEIKVCKCSEIRRL